MWSSDGLTVNKKNTVLLRAPGLYAFLVGFVMRIWQSRRKCVETNIFCETSCPIVLSS